MRLLLRIVAYRQYSPSKAPQRTDFYHVWQHETLIIIPFFDYKRPVVSDQ